MGGCRDGALPVEWSGGGAWSCATFFDPNKFYCAHKAISDACCFCKSGSQTGAHDPSAMVEGAVISQRTHLRKDVARKTHLRAEHSLWQANVQSQLPDLDDYAKEHVQPGVPALEEL